MVLILKKKKKKITNKRWLEVAKNNTNGRNIAKKDKKYGDL